MAAAAAVTQFAVVTEGLPLDRAAAEGWLDKLLPEDELRRLRALQQMLALSLTDTAKMLMCVPCQGIQYPKPVVPKSPRNLQA